ncbi:hypothetical protein G4B88_007884 [Cannabis sativa]|uniref:Uncharacterized protein n=1 Tax=Cannabis sativa TaxID=3483 RepID=A0A7J6DQJ9_CANSA|nr:hypothetical protein G4B88_007884 [Cannabis sativa]
MDSPSTENGDEGIQNLVCFSLPSNTREFHFVAPRTLWLGIRFMKNILSVEATMDPFFIGSWGIEFCYLNAYENKQPTVYVAFGFFIR